MKVGFNGRYLYDPGLRGFNRYSLCLLRALQELPNVELLLFSEERYPVHEVYKSALRATIRNLPASRTLYWEQWVLPRDLRRLGLDLFHAPAEGGVPFRKACPYVLTFHGVPDRSLASLVSSGELPGRLGDYLDVKPADSVFAARARQNVRSRFFSHLYLRAADLVITVSQFSKEELVRFMGLPPDKVRVIYEAADEFLAQPLPNEYIQQVRIRLKIPLRFVLFVGGFDKRKNVSNLLTAFAAVRKEDPELALVLVGIGGDMDGCRVRAASLGLLEGQSVFFLHRLADLELAALYRAATLFTTLSWHEGFCLPVVEAMTCGTPVLASSFGAIPEVVGDGGCLVDPRSHEEIVETMLSIVGETKVQDDLRARSLSRSKSFSWHKTALETRAVYGELCST